MTWIKTNRAVGIGSLPHTDIPSALRLISRTFLHWPHWPQLPQYGEQGFVIQYLHPLQKLGLLQMTAHNEPFFANSADGWDDKLSRFYELYSAFQAGDPQATSFFALDPGAFSGLCYFSTHFFTHFPFAEGVKGQISGPLSVGLQLKDESGRTAFYDNRLLDVLVKCLATQGILQARMLQSTGLPVLMFIDDPCLFLLGVPTYSNIITREIINAVLTEISRPLTAMGVKIGVHVCAQADWSVLFDLPLDVISFDAHNYFASMNTYSQQLQNFLHRDGKMAWGLVPTSDIAWKFTSNDLACLFEQQCSDLNKCGVDVSLLRRNIIWTPSCGTGALPQELAEQIYHLLAELSQLYRES